MVCFVSWWVIVILVNGWWSTDTRNGNLRLSHLTTRNLWMIEVWVAAIFQPCKSPTIGWVFGDDSPLVTVILRRYTIYLCVDFACSQLMWLWAAPGCIRTSNGSAYPRQNAAPAVPMDQSLTFSTLWMFTRGLSRQRDSSAPPYRKSNSGRGQLHWYKRIYEEQWRITYHLNQLVINDSNPSILPQLL